MNTSPTKSWHGHIEPRQDPLQLKLWRGGGGGLVQPVDSQDSNARPSVSLLVQFPMRSTFRLLRRHLAPARNEEGSNQLAQIEFCIFPNVSLVYKVLSPISTKTLKSNGQTIFCKDKNIEDMQSSQLSGYHRNSLCFKIIYVSEKFKNP